MFRRPVIAALSLFLALGGIAPAFGHPRSAARQATAAAPATPAAPPSAPPTATPPDDPAPPADPGAIPAPGELFKGDWGFWGPRIRGCESGNGPNGDPDYRALNHHTGASGAYQFMDSTWGGQFGVRKARDASPAEQELAAYQLFVDRGTGPWSYSFGCWHADHAVGAPNQALAASPIRPSPDTEASPAAAPAPKPSAARPPAAKPKPAPADDAPAPNGGVGGAVAGVLGHRR